MANRHLKQVGDLEIRQIIEIKVVARIHAKACLIGSNGCINERG